MHVSYLRMIELSARIPSCCFPAICQPHYTHVSR